MKLAIVGTSSRELNESEIEQLENLISKGLREHQPELVISGGAFGVDTIGTQIAHSLGIPVKEIFPKQRTVEGYMARNNVPRDMILMNHNHL